MTDYVHYTPPSRVPADTAPNAGPSTDQLIADLQERFRVANEPGQFSPGLRTTTGGAQQAYPGGGTGPWSGIVPPGPSDVGATIVDPYNPWNTPTGPMQPVQPWMPDPWQPADPTAPVSPWIPYVPVPGWVEPARLTVTSNGTLLPSTPPVDAARWTLGTPTTIGSRRWQLLCALEGSGAVRVTCLDGDVRVRWDNGDAGNDFIDNGWQVDGCPAPETRVKAGESVIVTGWVVAKAMRTHRGPAGQATVRVDLLG